MGCLAQQLTEDMAPIDDDYTRSREAVAILQETSFVVLAMAYFAGQFCSMFFRRGVVAWFFALILTGVLCWWAWLMHFLGISWLWSVGPIPAVLLVATWLRTPHWLLERTDRRARLRAALSVVMPAVVLAIAVIAFRVYEIPYADPGISVAEFRQANHAGRKSHGRHVS